VFILPQQRATKKGIRGKISWGVKNCSSRGKEGKDELTEKSSCTKSWLWSTRSGGRNTVGGGLGHQKGKK